MIDTEENNEIETKHFVVLQTDLVIPFHDLWAALTLIQEHFLIWNRTYCLTFKDISLPEGGFDPEQCDYNTLF